MNIGTTRIHQTSLTVLLVFSMALGLPAGAALAQQYRVVDLGTLGGDASGGQAIDEQGRVAGWSDTADGQRHAFRYQDGALEDLGVLPGGEASMAAAISEGRVVGYGGINEHGPQFPAIKQGFIHADGGIQPVGALHCPCDFNTRYGKSQAMGINSHGQVVGSSQSARGEWVSHAFIWQDGVMRDIGGAAGSWTISRAFDINDKGQVVGDYAMDAGREGPDAEFDRRAFLFEPGSAQDLGTLPGFTSSTARAINARGQVAGWSGSTNGEQHRAFLWSGGGMTDLGTLEGDEVSRALGLNDQGQVVGWSGSPSQSTSRGVLWQNGRMVDLNALLPPDSPWYIIEARGINQAGAIVATGTREQEPQVRAVLLERALLLEPR